MRTQPESIAARIIRIRPLVADGWSLCGFMGKHEREVMAAQTIQAAEANLKTHGEPFSFRDPNCLATKGNGLADNTSAYRWLVAEGYFAEDTRQGRPVIFPTMKLLDALERYFKGEED